MEKVILIRYGEIFLKGRNRSYFEKVLLNNCRKALREIPDVNIIRAQGRFFAENYTDEDAVIDALTRVFGLVSISPALKIDGDFEEIAAVSKQMMGEYLDEQAKEQMTFKVESRRADKRFPMDSMTIRRELGARLLKAFPQLKVDVHNPDVVFNVEVREHTYLYYKMIPCAGGMPVGSNGKAALLLSGGIDSPVAGWMIAKRGVALTAVHFHSFPYTSDRSKEKVIELARILTRYTGSIRLHVVPFTKIQQELYERCPDEELTILMRRYMMKIAERIAVKEGAAALVTGESIGQVASQTIESLAVTNDAVDMPVFRPLIGFDKIDIMETAEAIGTYETSILPYEDCCTVFTPRHPVTRPKLERILRSEKLIDGETLIQEALDNVEVITL
ncbi:MAG: tRNA 4-thiouridine(8) synthase ThiI [Clostridiales bacterium]|nr:tRNA 4-thiouridine(8) synthase ThiI [Clostridiales bacterium]